MIQISETSQILDTNQILQIISISHYLLKSKMPQMFSNSNSNKNLRTISLKKEFQVTLTLVKSSLLHRKKYLLRLFYQVWNCQIPGMLPMEVIHTEPMIFKLLEEQLNRILSFWRTIVLKNMSLVDWIWKVRMQVKRERRIRFRCMICITKT